MRVRRLAAVLIAAALIAGGGPAGATGTTEGRHEREGRSERIQPDRWRGPCSGWQLGETLRASDFGTAVYDRRIGRLYDCVFERWAPAYETAFRAVIDRESGWNAWAKNPATAGACRAWSDDPYGSCGLAQHLARYWPARVLFGVWPTWFAAWPRISPLDPRANLIVTARMVAVSGICPHWC